MSCYSLRTRRQNCNFSLVDFQLCTLKHKVKNLLRSGCSFDAARSWVLQNHSWNKFINTCLVCLLIDHRLLCVILFRARWDIITHWAKFIIIKNILISGGASSLERQLRRHIRVLQYFGLQTRSHGDNAALHWQNKGVKIIV